MADLVRHLGPEERYLASSLGFLICKMGMVDGLLSRLNTVPHEECA